jgi:hypothetical protein
MVLFGVELPTVILDVADFVAVKAYGTWVVQVGI